jgi:phage terminase large subunit-like protein
VYGYDVCFGVVDEGWDVAPDTVSEGLEPALMERQSPQLHLTSTAHRKATSLMRSALLNALSTDDPETLLLLWGARPGSDPSDEQVWKAASPHWSEDRRKMIASKYETALAGEDDPELDDPDPMRGFEAQYLNVWRLHVARSQGDRVVSEQEWQALTTDPPDRAPDAVAVEDWYGEGVSVALAWRVGGLVVPDGVVVALSTHDDVAAAAAAVSASKFGRTVTVGASIASDPAWKAAGVRTTPGKGTVRGAVDDLERLLSEGVLAHDGDPELTRQVLALRTSPGVDGPRVRSTTAADAVKAATWAALAARGTRRSSVVVL